jgi:HSP20 family protein
MNWRDLMALHERATRHPASQDGAWTPSVDLVETEAAFLIVVELPGLGPGDFSITAAADGLTLSGERPPMSPNPQRYFRMERGHGRFSRTFAFADAVQADGIRATFERGVLRITVPKLAARDTRRISIG